MKPTNLLIAACLAIMATIAACSKKITDPSASENISGWFVGYWHINDVESSPQKAVDGEGYYFLSHQENTENLNWYIFFGGDRRYSAIYETAESSIIRHSGSYTYEEGSYVFSDGVLAKRLLCKVGGQTIEYRIYDNTPNDDPNYISANVFIDGEVTYHIFAPEKE